MTCNTNAAEQEIFRGGGLPHAPNPTPRKGVTAIVLRIRLHRYCGISSKNNLAIAPNPTDAFQKNSVENHVRAASLHASIIILIDIHRPFSRLRQAATPR